METINGYTVIASHAVRNGERVILAVIERRGSTEYVTARAKAGPVREWYWGHYFGPGRPTESEAFLAAVEDFQERIQ